MAPFNVVAIISPAPGKESRLEEILTKFASEVQKNESGALRYQPYKQNGDNAGTDFVVIERYDNEKTFKDHFTTEHFEVVGKQIEDEGLLAKPLNIMQLTALGGGFDAR